MDPGDVVAGRFEIERLAGAGGMGDVYRARDLTTGESVALKVMNRPDEQRFAREARILSEVRHPSVVEYVTHGVAESGKPFLALGWLEGEVLEARLRRGVLEVDEAVELARRLADGLQAAHVRGIVHRDIKPSNIVLRRGSLEDPVLVDFGVARRKVRSRRVTLAGMSVGTPHYMPPEQIRGVDLIDARADVFSLGAVLFECLAGRPPFVADSLTAVLTKILFDDPPAVTSIRADAPPSLSILLDRMLAKDREDRPQNGGEVVQCLLGTAGDRRAGLAAERTLGQDEIVPVCVVLASPPDPEVADSEAVTAAPSDVGDAGVHELATIAARQGARLEYLFDGTRAICLRPPTSPTDAGAASILTDMVRRGARVALDIHAIASGLHIAVTTGGGGSITVDADDPFQRAARILIRARDVGARPGIRIDATTLEILDGYVETRPDPPDVLLLRELEGAASTRRQGATGLASETVGRTLELSTARAMFQACVEDVELRVLVIQGEGGSGKSHLLEAIVEQLRHDPARPAIWTARADPFFGVAPFSLLARLVRDAATIRDGDDRPAQLDQLRAAVSGALASGTDPEVLHEEIGRALVDWITATATERPLVLALDDASVADTPSLKLLSNAMKWLDEVPVFLVLTTRPDMRHAVPVRPDGNLTELRLGPLSDTAVRALASAVVGDGIDHAALDRIVQVAGGNALLTRELARAAGAGRADAPSQTVLMMVGARLATLPDTARRALRLASLVGETFSIAPLEAMMSDVDRSTILAMLRTLEAAHVLRRTALGWAFENRVIREAAYASFYPRDRASAHLAMAHWLGTVADAPPRTVAEHYDRAGVRAEAAHWFVKSARSALAANDVDQSIELSLAAIAGELSPDDRADAYLVLAEAYRWTGDFASAAEAAFHTLEFAVRGSLVWIRAVDEAVAAAGRHADYELVTRMAQDLSAVDEPADLSAWVRALASTGRHLFHAGDYAGADELIALASQRSAPDGFIDAGARAELARLCAARARHRGDVFESLQGYEIALVQLDSAGDRRGAANARVSLGFSLIEVGDFARAEPLLLESLGEAKKLGLASVETRARQNLALVRAAAGDFDEAVALARQVIQESAARQDVRFEGWTTVYLASFELGRGDAKAALEAAHEADSILEPSPPARAGAQAVAARALVRLGEPVSAGAYAERAMATLNELGGIEEFELLVHVASIEAALSSGRQDDANASIARAMHKLHELGDRLPADLRRTYFGAVPINVRLQELAQGVL